MVTFTLQLWMSVFCTSNSIVVARKKPLSKAGSDGIKSMIDSSKVYDDGKHVELQQILNTSQDPAV